MVRSEQGKFGSTLPAVDMTHLQTSGSEPDENVSLFYDRIMKLSVCNMRSWGCIGWWLTVTEFCVGTHVTARVYSQLPLVQRVRLTRRVSHSDVTFNFSSIQFSPVLMIFSSVSDFFEQRKSSRTGYRIDAGFVLSSSSEVKISR